MLNYIKNKTMFCITVWSCKLDLACQNFQLVAGRRHLGTPSTQVGAGLKTSTGERSYDVI